MAKGGGLTLELRQVSVRLPGARAGAGPAVNQVSLAIGAGEQVAVVGSSGAGKTSLLLAAAAALRLEQGQLLLDGEDPWRLDPRARHLRRGQLFFAPHLPPLPQRQRVVTAILAGRLPVLGFWPSLVSLLRPTELEAAAAALRPFELETRLFDRVDRLSGGERQRVGLARALLSPARLWLLDEPLGGLDPVRATQALATVREQAAARGVTLVVSLHQVELALRNFPRVVGLREGELVLDSPARSVTPAQLERLYATGGPAPAPAEDAPAPALDVPSLAILSQ